MADSDNSTPFSASAYDALVEQTIPFYEVIQEQTVDLILGLRPEVSCWLDTGCGTGRTVEIALPLFPRTGFILADPSAAMLQEARSKFHQLDRRRVRFLPPTSTQGLLAHKDSLLPQVITAVLSHHYLTVEKRAEATRVCYELLEKNGVFVTAENIRAGSAKGTRIGLERWKRFQLSGGRSIPNVEAHLKRFGSEYFPIGVDEHLELLKKVGFRTVECFWLAYMQAGFYAIK